MCRNIRPLYNFAPAVHGAGVRDLIDPLLPSRYTPTRSLEEITRLCRAD